jgi:hypothetical protein
MDFDIYYGNTKVIDLTITADGEAVDLTGMDLVFTAKVDHNSPALIQVDTDDGGIVVTSAVDGEARLTLTPTETELLENKVYAVVYDVKLVDGANVYTVLTGRLMVNPVVSGL